MDIPHVTSESKSALIQVEEEQSVKKMIDSMNGFMLASCPLHIDAVHVATTAASSDRCRVLLENMVSKDDLNDPDLSGEIEEEATNYGRLKTAVEIEEKEDGIFVTLSYDLPQDAAKAFKVMNGRNFGGQTIKASLIV